MRRLALVAAVACLAACGKGQDDLTAKTDAPAPDKAPPEWTLQVGGSGASLGHASQSPSGPVADLKLACLRGGQFEVQVEQVRPVESEDRLSIGAGGDAYAMAATAVIEAEPAFVKAAGPIDETLLKLIETGMPISASYGATPIGPFAAPEREQLQLFLTACRILAKEGQG